MTASLTQLAFADSTSPLPETIYQRILDDLVTQAIAPGDRLTVDSLARDYQVSQTPIRQALTRLEGEGLVEKHHLRGYRACERLSRPQFEQLFAVRAILERAAAQWAALHAGTDDVDRLQELLEQLRSPSSRPGEAVRLDAQFHDAIARASGNEILYANLSRLHVHLHLARVQRESPATEEVHQEHELIVQAISWKDPILAEAAMFSHIERSWARLDGDI